MMTRIGSRIGLALLGLNIATASFALTLEDYGIRFTSTGLVDVDTQLEWLNADLTAGTPDAIDVLLEDGWRIANYTEVRYLLTRDGMLSPPSGNGDETIVPLAFSDFMILIGALGISTNGFDDAYVEPWACGSQITDANLCSDTRNWAFTPFILIAEQESDIPLFGTTRVSTLEYLSEVPLYGDFEVGVCSDCIGRTLLVRAVPIPAALWLMLSSLGAWYWFGGHTNTRRR
ncbi:MAG: hypothetical protein AAF465_02070 [Pseudomonadota bacterium]